MEGYSFHISNLLMDFQFVTKNFQRSTKAFFSQPNLTVKTFWNFRKYEQFQLREHFSKVLWKNELLFRRYNHNNTINYNNDNNDTNDIRRDNGTRQHLWLRVGVGCDKRGIRLIGVGLLSYIEPHRNIPSLSKS